MLIVYYMIGGIVVDIWYRIGIKNFYVIGEVVSNGFYGVNRFVSNFLFECIVLGFEVVRMIVRDKLKGREVKEFFYYGYEIGDIELLREIFWGYVGIVRNERIFKEGLKKLRDVEVDLRFKFLVRGVFECVLVREESCGVYYCEDFLVMRKEFERLSFFDGKCRL